jgi:hypothetical protein
VVLRRGGSAGHPRNRGKSQPLPLGGHPRRSTRRSRYCRGRRVTLATVARQPYAGLLPAGGRGFAGLVSPWLRAREGRAHAPALASEVARL